MDKKYIIEMAYPKKCYLVRFYEAGLILNTDDNQDKACIYTSYDSAKAELVKLQRYLGRNAAQIKEI